MCGTVPRPCKGALLRIRWLGVLERSELSKPYQRYGAPLQTGAVPLSIKNYKKIYAVVLALHTLLDSFARLQVGDPTM
jgi:hypothetical protein